MHIRVAFLGKALGSHSDNVVITTKVGMGAPAGQGGGSKASITAGCEASLARLGRDHIDMYHLHAPDPQTPISESLEAFAELVAAGKVRAIGCSNFSGAQLEEAAAVAAELCVPTFVNAQNDYSLLNRAAAQDILPKCQQLGVVFTPFFPLAGGMLTGKYRRGEEHPENSRFAAWGPHAEHFATEERYDAAEQLAGFAEAHGHSLPELALSWLAQTPSVATVIAGATSPEQVRQNAAATSAWTMTESQRAEVDALTRSLS